jgi:protein gp37
MYQRFHWNEEVKLDLTVLDKIAQIKEPSRIFLCSTHDLFGEWIGDKWIFDIITACHKYPQHKFLLLTKNPKRYLDFTFRNNFWTGITMTGEAVAKQFKIANQVFEKFPNGFVSFEPLLNEYGVIPRNCKWIIIGGLTPSPIHKIEWVDDLLKQADKFKIPVFIKNNAHYPRIRQEFREIK